MDKDLLICELQKVNEELIEVFFEASDPNHNPTYLAKKLKKIKLKIKEFYICL
tara:strand:+ start:493 stop:651 length:159 start_codon:yes stop_codon:yes gene_type:complete